MKAGLKWCIRMAKSEIFHKYNLHPIVDEFSCREHQPFSDDYIECFLKHWSFTIYHPVGTCKMGPNSDPLAVVDAQLRTHGVKNLRVVDASIMPALVGANTNAPSIMIGEKGAAMIIQRWKMAKRNIHKKFKTEL